MVSSKPHFQIHLISKIIYTLQHLQENQKHLSNCCICLQHQIKPKSLFQLTVLSLSETTEELYCIMQASLYATAIKIITMLVDFMCKLE